MNASRWMLVLIAVVAQAAGAQEVAGSPGVGAPPPPPAVWGRRARFVLAMPIDHQYKTFGTVVFSDGKKAKLGDAVIAFAGGVAAPLTPDERFELQATLGYRFAKVNASNGNITYKDVPLEVTGHVNAGMFRLGAGPSFHFGPGISGSGFASDVDVSFQTAVGGVASIEFSPRGPGSRFGIGGRLVWLKLRNTYGSFDASGIGLTLAAYL